MGPPVLHPCDKVDGLLQRRRRPIFGILSLVTGVAVVGLELRVRPLAVGPELVTDAAMMAMYLSSIAIVSGLIALARRERWRGTFLLGAALPFIVLLIEGVIKGKLRFY
jgi:hypothetical protein